MANLGLVALRMIVGAIFVVHGTPKLFGGADKQLHSTAKKVLGEGFEPHYTHGGLKNFANALQSMDVPAPHTAALGVAGLEFVGGALLILGWFTRPVSLLLVGDMSVAIWKVHAKSGLVGGAGYEFPLALIGSLLALATSGPGGRRNKKKQEQFK